LVRGRLFFSFWFSFGFLHRADVWRGSRISSILTRVSGPADGTKRRNSRQLLGAETQDKNNSVHVLLLTEYLMSRTNTLTKPAAIFVKEIRLVFCYTGSLFNLPAIICHLLLLIHRVSLRLAVKILFMKGRDAVSPGLCFGGIFKPWGEVIDS